MGNAYTNETHSEDIERDIARFRRSSTVGAEVQIQKVSAVDERELLNAHFEIILEAKSVDLVGSWDDWSTRQKMDYKNGKFVLMTKLPAGKYQYKFVSEDHWLCSNDHPQESDSNGNINNVIELEARVIRQLSPRKQKWNAIVYDSDEETSAPAQLNNVEKLLDKIRNFSPPRIADVARTHRYFIKKDLLNRKFASLRAEGRFDEYQKLSLIEDYSVSVLIPSTVNPFA